MPKMSYLYCQSPGSYRLCIKPRGIRHCPLSRASETSSRTQSSSSRNQKSTNIDQMSKDPIEKWLDAMQFEVFRIKSFAPLHTEVLESRIKQLNSVPVTGGARINLNENLREVKCLNQDLQSLRVLEGSLRKIQQARDRLREKSMSDVKNQCIEASGKFDTTHVKTKIERMKRQRQHFASLRQLWPKADFATKRRMVGLVARYGRSRLVTGIRISLLAFTFKIVRRVWR